MKRIGLLFDCLRAPYDIAQIYQVATALDECDLYLSGNCIDPHHKKVISKVKSWGIEEIPEFRRFDSLEEAARVLHKESKFLIGTSPHATRNLYSVDFTENDTVLVFGTESTGLSRAKRSHLDDLITIPMNKKCKFLTLPTAVPIAAYEAYRQINGGQYASPKG